MCECHIFGQTSERNTISGLSEAVALCFQRLRRQCSAAIIITRTGSTMEAVEGTEQEPRTTPAQRTWQGSHSQCAASCRDTEQYIAALYMTGRRLRSIRKRDRRSAKSAAISCIIVGTAFVADPRQKLAVNSIAMPQPTQTSSQECTFSSFGCLFLSTTSPSPGTLGAAATFPPSTFPFAFRLVLSFGNSFTKGRKSG
jgi:hypothetical protein